MREDDIAALQGRFSLDGEVQFLRGTHGMTIVEIAGRAATGRISLQGAQLLAWTPHGQNPVIWLSSRAQFASGKPLRGGIPVCWPWFGAHDENPALPAHGFARTADWEVIEAQRLGGGSIRLGFRLLRSAASLAQWPHPAVLEIRYTLGKALEIELWTYNRTPDPILLGEALHTYFSVGDVRQVRIQGLDGCEYLDKVEENRRKRQQGPVTIAGETDRVYLDTTADCVIEDPVLGRSIKIEKRESASTVIWNPWAEKAAILGDFEEQGHLGMICVESANAAVNRLTIPAGGEHRLWVQYSVQPL